MTDICSMTWSKIFPITEWVAHYPKKWLAGDLLAGLTVGVMMIPQSMAYAMIVGIEPIYGLYAATLPIFIYAIFGTSRKLSVGPTAMTALLVYTGVSSLYPKDAAEYLSLVVSLTMMVGIIQLIMGTLRLGFLVNFLSTPVIKGYTSAAAIIIMLSQVKHILGLEIKDSSLFSILGEVFNGIANINWVTFLIFIIGIFVLFLTKKISTKLPAALILVLIGIGSMAFFQWHEVHSVKVLGEIPNGLPILSLPNLHIGQWLQLSMLALTISIIGLMESFSIAKILQQKNQDSHLYANQELNALGFSNIASSLLTSIPISGGFSRTAVNNQV